MNLEQYIDDNLDLIKEELEELIHDVIPEVVQSYDWQDDEEEGYEIDEYDWYYNYKHTTGYQAEYEGAESYLKKAGYETSDDNIEMLLQKCDIDYF